MKIAKIAFVGSVAAGDLDYLRHLSKYGKSYLTREEYDFRKAIFEANMAKVQAHNSDPDSEFQLGENHMADWTDDEYKSLFNSVRHEMPQQQEKVEEDSAPSLPKAIDWRAKGAVSPVRDQGQCSSSWAISSVASLESLYF